MEIPWISIPLKLFHIDTQKWPIFEKPEKTTFSKFPSFLGYPAVSFRENVLQNDAIIWKRDTFSRTFDDSIMGRSGPESIPPQLLWRGKNTKLDHSYLFHTIRFRVSTFNFRGCFPGFLYWNSTASARCLKPSTPNVISGCH